MITGKKDLDEVVDELNQIEKIEGSIEKLEKKIVNKLNLKHKFLTIEEAIKNALKIHHHHKVEIENIHYNMDNHVVYVIITLNNSLSPITRLNMSEDIKDNLMMTKGDIKEAVVNFYLHGKEDLTEYEISKWNEISDF
ncbi:MAG: hypothetical protein ACRDD2_10705 [Sarcina sp.]